MRHAVVPALPRYRPFRSHDADGQPQGAPRLRDEGQVSPGRYPAAALPHAGTGLAGALPTRSSIGFRSAEIDGACLHLFICCCLKRTRLRTRQDAGRQAPFGRRGWSWLQVPLLPRGVPPVCLRCRCRVALASLALWSLFLLSGPPDRGPVFRRGAPQEVVPPRVGNASDSTGPCGVLRWWRLVPNLRRRLSFIDVLGI